MRMSGMAGFDHLPDEKDWQRIYPILLDYSVRQTKFKNLPKSAARDFVQESIARLFVEKRKWDPNKVDLVKYLKGVIRSLASHMTESAYHVRRQIEARKDNEESISLVE